MQRFKKVLHNQFYKGFWKAKGNFSLCKAQQLKAIVNKNEMIGLDLLNVLTEGNKHAKKSSVCGV